MQNKSDLCIELDSVCVCECADLRTGELFRLAKRDPGCDLWAALAVPCLSRAWLIHVTTVLSPGAADLGIALLSACAGRGRRGGGDAGHPGRRSVREPVRVGGQPGRRTSRPHPRREPRPLRPLGRGERRCEVRSCMRQGHTPVCVLGVAQARRVNLSA